jgi:hypothetical protein
LVDAGRELARVDRLDEPLMVEFVLVRVGDGESTDGLFEGLSRSKVGSDRQPTAGK